MTDAVCSRALEVHGREPLAVCSLVERVETVESEVSALRKDFRSVSWRLSVIVGAVGAVSPHLVSFGEWFLGHLPAPSLLLSALF
jgi:hypothetical protein